MDNIINIINNISDAAIIWEFIDKDLICVENNESFSKKFKIDDEIKDNKINDIYDFYSKKYLRYYQRCLKYKKNQEYNVFHDGSRIYSNIIYMDESNILEILQIIKIDDNELMTDPFHMIIITDDKQKIYNANFLFLRNTEYARNDIITKNVNNLFSNTINFSEYNKIYNNNIILKNKNLLNVDLYTIKLNGMYNIIVIKDISCIKQSIINNKIFKNIESSVIVFDKDDSHFEKYTCIDNNDSFLKAFSNNETIVGKNIIDIFDGNIYFKIKKSYKRIVQKNNYIIKNIEYKNKHYNFNCFIIENHIFGIIIVDISDSIQVKSLQYSKNNLLIGVIDKLKIPTYSMSKTLSLLNETPLNIEQSEYINKTLEYNQILSSLISNFNDYANLKLKKIDIHEEIFNIREEINKYYEYILSKLHEKNVELICNINTDIPPYIITDKEKFKQIIYNLLANALKFTNNGKIIINVFTNHISENEHNLFVEIIDSGIGIEKNNINNIFKSFYQCDHDVCNDTNICIDQGSGLGLSICKELCILLGGDISVTSEYNVGSTFSIIIPVKEFTDILKIEEKFIDKFKNKNILVVDENSKNRISISKILIDLSIKTSMASTSKEALFYINNDRYDACFINMDSKNMGGDEIAKKIKDINEYIPIVIMSSKGHSSNGNPSNYSIVYPIEKSKLIKLFINIFSDVDAYSKKNSTEGLQITNYLPILLGVGEGESKITQLLKDLSYSNVKTITNNSYTENYSVLLFDVSNVIAYQYIKKIKNNPDKPYIIALINKNDHKSKRKCERYQVDAFIAKPVDLNELKALLKVINRRINDN